MRLFVTEFAEKKLEIERKLSSHSEVIIEHLMKILVLPNHESVNHWKKEVFSHLHIIDNLKGSHKLPTAKQIMNWTYYKHYEWLQDRNCIKAFFNDLLYDYGIDDLNVGFSYYVDKIYSVADNYCKEYFQWLADNLSKYKRISNQDIYAEIDKLTEKYSLWD